MSKFRQLVLEALDASQEAAIINLHKSGDYTIQELAEIFKLPFKDVRDIIRKSLNLDKYKPKVYKSKINVNTPKKHKISSETIEKIQELCKTGQYTIKQLADQFNLAYGTVFKIIKQNPDLKPLKIYTRDPAQIEKEQEIRDLYKTKQYTYQELGDKFNLSKERIRLIVSDLRDDLGLNTHQFIKPRKNPEKDLDNIPRNEEIRKLYLNKEYSVTELADMFNLTPTSIYRIIYDLSSARRKETKELNQKIKEFIKTLYQSGQYTYKDLAEKFGVSVIYIWRICNE